MVRATDGAGKGDDYRPVDKDKYDRTYLRIFGERCPECKGKGVLGLSDFEGSEEICTVHFCLNCKGVGYIERKRNESRR